MRTFVYRARFEPGEKRGVIVVSFPDVPEAITEGRGEADATTQAQEALGLALLTYPARNIPRRSLKAKGGDLVPRSTWSRSTGPHGCSTKGHG